MYHHPSAQYYQLPPYRRSHFLHQNRFCQFKQFHQRLHLIQSTIMTYRKANSTILAARQTTINYRFRNIMGTRSRLSGCTNATNFLSLRTSKRANRYIWRPFTCKGTPSPGSSDGSRKLATQIGPNFLKRLIDASALRSITTILATSPTHAN